MAHYQRGNLSIVTKPSGEIDYSGFHVDDPQRHQPFNFEIINLTDWLVFIFENPHFPIHAGIIYIILIFGIQHLMKNRKPFDLKTELFLWNAALGIFSIVGFIRFTPQFFEELAEGFRPSICKLHGGNRPMAFWALVFTFSKYVELGDTVFVVLRKKPLQFIQWYHHLVTLMAVWITMPYLEPIGYYYMAMNYGVHSLMYPYFALMGLDIKIPRPVAHIVTSLQLSQMLIGLFVNSYSAYLYYSGADCYRHPASIKLFFILYGSFVLLFGQLFYKLVVKKSSKAKHQ